MLRMAHLYHLTIVFISCTCIVGVRVYRAWNLFIFFFYKYIYLLPNQRTFGFFGQTRLRLIPYVFVVRAHNTQYTHTSMEKGTAWLFIHHTFQRCLFVVFSSLSRFFFSGFSHPKLVVQIGNILLIRRIRRSTSSWIRLCVLRTYNEPLIHSLRIHKFCYLYF